MMIEQRKHPRINKSMIIRFRLLGSHLGMSSRCEDISEGGMRLSILQRLDLGMSLTLDFKLEETAEPITAKAKVVWQNDRDNAYYPFVVGLKFFKISPADSKKIHDYVTTMLCRENPADAARSNN
ncbi:MAG: PilZ domain-containing protein [Candidatus Omnitrophica bacterium]|nr:PilZ domain-containing protein [Candidatus Omnitrophota bacterium]